MSGGRARATVSNRTRSTQDSSTGYTLQFREFLFRSAAKASLSTLIISKCLEKFCTTKIRPESLGHIDFRIRHLPQKKVTETKLTACADQQVRVWNACRPEMPSKKVLINLLR